LTVVALSSVLFLLLWRIEVDKANGDGFRHAVTSGRLNSLCGAIESRYDSIARDITRMTAPDRTTIQADVLLPTVETARRQADLLDGLGAPCRGPDPKNTDERPTLGVMMLISDLDSGDRLRAAANELGAWARWHADELRKARASDWAAKEWEAFERSLKSR